MQDPEITVIDEAGYAEGYYQGEHTHLVLERLSAEYPYLSTKKPMNTRWKP